MNKLHAAAIAIGDSPKRVVQQFTESLDVMAQYSGPRAMQVFQGLTSLSKQTAIGMGELIGIANQFDTFETAAGSVAKLNAILGGAYFNSIQMLNASEEKRLYLLRAGFEATNKSWQSLGRFEKKALAAAAGFKSLEQAGAFFTGDMAKVEAMTRAQEEQVETQQKLAQVAGTLATVFQQMARIIQDAGFKVEGFLDVTREVVGLMKDLGFKGMVTVGIMVSFTNKMAQAVVQTRLLAAAAGTAGAAGAMASLGTALVGLAPLLLTAGAAWYYFSNKLREKRSPVAHDLPAITAHGVSKLAQAAEAAGPHLGDLANKINLLNEGKIVSLSRALNMVAQVSSPNVNFAPVVEGFSEITKAVNTLDEGKINSFSTAMARLGATMKMIPRENVVAVTQLTKEARSIAALPVAAAARQGAQISAQGSAVRQARASEAPRGGGQSRGGLDGVLVTDSITVNVGGTALTQRIKETVRNEYAKIRRRTA